MVILKTLTGILPANEVEVMFTDVNIDNNSIIEVYYDSNDVYTVSTSQTSDNVYVVTSPHDYQVGIKLLINNVDSFSPYDDSSIREEVNIINDSLGDVIDDVRTLENDYMALDGVVNNIARDVSNKQDTLTAGTNISIVNNVISSTGGSSANWTMVANPSTQSKFTLEKKQGAFFLMWWNSFFLGFVHVGEDNVCRFTTICSNGSYGSYPSVSYNSSTKQVTLSHSNNYSMILKCKV